jgi:5-methylcytosine-specific restriction endonuclease McrA
MPAATAAPAPVLTNELFDAKRFLEDLQDHLATRFDAQALAVYIYLVRKTRLLGNDTLWFAIRSARFDLPTGISQQGKPMASSTILKRVRGLIRLGLVEILKSTFRGTHVRVYLPWEVPGVVPSPSLHAPQPLDSIDFFTVPDNRLALLRRENYRCFYCLRGIDSSSFIVEHVVSRPEGNNSYRNLVAACSNCNGRKSNRSADDLLRDLYRDGLLTGDEFQGRLQALRVLKRGDLRPAA